MRIQNVLKPAVITSIGLIAIAASMFLSDTPISAPPIVAKIGAALVIIGSIWFFVKRGK